MKPLNGYKVGDIIQSRQDVFKWVGGPIQYCEGERLRIIRVDETSIQACTEGGIDVGHVFCGQRELSSLRFIERPSDPNFASVAKRNASTTTAGKTANKNKHNRN